MRIEIPCSTCMAEYQENGAGDAAKIGMPSVDVPDSGIYTARCPAGHEFRVAVEGTKYEVLYEIALNAIKDGYYRESISSFSSSLERFYEFFIKCTFNFGDVDSDLYEKAWKKVGNQSERQLGAYIACNSLFYNNEPEILSQKNVTRRNQVIHKGYIPELNEALEFGQSVCNAITSGLDLLYKMHGNDFRNFYYTEVPSFNLEGDFPTMRYMVIGLRWEDIKCADSKRRVIENALGLKFGDRWKI